MPLEKYIILEEKDMLALLVFMLLINYTSCLLSFSIKIYSLSYFCFSLFVRFLWQVVCAMGSNCEWNPAVCHLSLTNTKHGERGWFLIVHKIMWVFIAIYLDWWKLQQNKEGMWKKQVEEDPQRSPKPQNGNSPCSILRRKLEQQVGVYLNIHWGSGAFV